VVGTEGPVLEPLEHGHGRIVWVSNPIEEESVLLLPDRGRSLKRLNWPNLLRVLCTSFNEKPWFQDHGGSTLIALNAGLMKPRKGFTTVTGNQKSGGG
jgi:hypothetical protein